MEFVLGLLTIIIIGLLVVIVIMSDTLMTEKDLRDVVMRIRDNE